MPDTVYARRVQRRGLGALFLAIGVLLLAVAVWSAVTGGRAWVVAFAAGALGLWMLDLGRRAVGRRARRP
jgi:hypothetical protein